jgi:hypothetical protein
LDFFELSTYVVHAVLHVPRKGLRIDLNNIFAFVKIFFGSCCFLQANLPLFFAIAQRILYLLTSCHIFYRDVRNFFGNCNGFLALMLRFELALST